MGRVRALNDVQYVPHSEEHKEKLSVIHRARWGAPEGMATVRGVHVPLEYRDVLAFFGNRVAQKLDKEIATQFVQQIKDEQWVRMPELTRKYQTAMIVSENRKLIREMQMEAYYANKNSR